MNLITSSLMFGALALQGAAPAGMVRSGEAGTAAEQVVQRQLEAYNAHDIDAFAATYSDDVEIVQHPGIVRAKGKAALKSYYGPFLQRLKPVARVPHRTVMGDRIADVEAITLEGTEYCCAVAVYQVKSGLISRVDLIASDDFMKAKK